MDKDLLSPKQVAEKLKVNYRTVLNRIEKGEIRTIRIGKNFYIPAEAITEYLDNSSTIQPLRISVAVVLKDNEVLLVKRRVKEGKLLWQFPAGRIHYDEQPQAAAERECLEECNVHCAVKKKLGKRVHPDTKAIIYYFLCDYVAGSPSNLDPNENSDVLWVEKSRVLSLLTSSVYEPIRKLLV